MLTHRLRQRLRPALDPAGESGQGLIELLIALTVLVAGIFAVVAGFSSSYVSINRAGQLATASALADKQMETYRRFLYTTISLDTTAVATAASNTTYTGDVALQGGTQTGTVNITATCGASAWCLPIQSVVGPDHNQYRIDTYIVWTCALGTIVSPASATPTCSNGSNTNPLKKISVVVRDAEKSNRTIFREQSTFDPTTGTTPS